MNNKKVVFIIFAFAIVAALLTMYKTSQTGMMGKMDLCRAGEYCATDMGVTDSYYGGVGMGTVAPMPMVGEKEMMYTEPAIGIMPPVYYGDDALDIVDRVYDRSAYQGVVVNNVSEYMKQMKEYLQSVGGVILNSNQNVYDDMQYGYLTAKVPAERFDEVTMMVTTKAKKVVNESINTTDVTGQQQGMVDRVTQLQEEKAKKATELAAATTDVEKKRIQAEIDRIDTQIKQVQRSQEKFTEQMKYATISITAANTERYFNPDNSGNAWEELKRAWKSLGGTGKVLAYFLIWVTVYAIIWLPIVLGARWVWMRMHPTSAKK